MGWLMQVIGTIFVVLWVAANLGYGHFTFIYGPEPVQCTKASGPTPTPEQFNL